jgi:acyl-CoA thioesterase I
MRSFQHPVQLVLAIGLLAFGCSRAPESSPEPAAAGMASDVRTAVVAEPLGDSEAVADDRPRIVFLGDSLTAGYGLQRSESVPSLIQARLDAGGYHYRVVNAGVSGDTSAGGLSRLEYSLQGDVELLVLELGANDGLRGLPVAAMKRNLDQIIRLARARGITVLLTGMEAPPNYGAAYTSEYRAAFRELAEEHDLPFIPFFLDGVAGIPELNISDGMHPNPDGARIVEATVWRALEPLLDK